MGTRMMFVALAAAIMMVAMPASAAVFTVVRDYDPTDVNTVNFNSDGSAAYSGGAKQGALAAFTASVAAAYDAGLGGVVNFDSPAEPMDASAQFSSFQAAYGTGTLTVTRSDGTWGYFTPGHSNYNDALPISGANALWTSNSLITFSQPVLEFGVTVLARNDADINWRPGTVSAIAQLEDGTILDAIVATIGAATNDVKGNRDTFVRFVAPEGSAGIASVTFSIVTVAGGNAGYTGFDDMGFVIPEPATMGLLAIGALGILARRRR